MLSQKEAVYAAVIAVKEKIEGRVVLSKEETEKVVNMLIDGFKSGQVSLNRQYNESELRKYTVGLVNNWLRKDTRLNGGEQYTPKNPGSRVGAGDEQLKALKTLKSMLTDPEEIAEVESHIQRRLSEIAAEKAKKSLSKINLDALPQELRSKIP